MPNISASEYTQYLKYKAAATSYTTGPPRMVHITDQVSPTTTIVNSFLKASEASFRVNPQSSVITGLNYVKAPTPERTNHPNALSTLSWASGAPGTTSSKFQQSGGLPAKNVVGTYTRLPQHAGWIQGNTVSSGPKLF
jgi:hypothetical protein